MCVSLWCSGAAFRAAAAPKTDTTASCANQREIFSDQNCQDGESTAMWNGVKFHSMPSFPTLRVAGLQQELLLSKEQGGGTFIARSRDLQLSRATSRTSLQIGPSFEPHGALAWLCLVEFVPPPNVCGPQASQQLAQTITGFRPDVAFSPRPRAGSTVVVGCRVVSQEQQRDNLTKDCMWKETCFARGLVGFWEEAHMRRSITNENWAAGENIPSCARKLPKLNRERTRRSACPPYEFLCLRLKPRSILTPQGNPTRSPSQTRRACISGRDGSDGPGGSTERRTRAQRRGVPWGWWARFFFSCSAEVPWFFFC